MSYNSLFGLGSHSEDASLECWHPLQDDAANTTVVDQSSNSLNGTLLSMGNTEDNAVAGPNSWLTSAISFPGNNLDGVNLGDQASLTNDNFTVLIRFNWDTHGRSLVSKWQGSANREFWFTVESSGQPKLAVSSTGSNNKNKQSTTGTTTGTWNNIAARQDGASTDFNVRLNKSTVLSETSSHSSIYDSTARYIIGAIDGTTATFDVWDGELVDHAYFSRVLTDAECDEWEDGPEPINSVAPVLSGTETEGETLSVTTGTWGLDSPFSGGSNGTITYTYQWTRSDDAGGAGEADIGGATSSSYTLVTADVGKFVRCRVAASNDGGNDADADTSSDMSGAIAAAGGGIAPNALHLMKLRAA